MTKIFLLMSIAACVSPSVAAFAQAGRDPHSPPSRHARQTVARPTPPTDNRPTGPFDNQLKKFSAPLSANGAK